MKATRKRAKNGQPADGDLMTFAEAAEALKINVRVVRRLALRGEFARVYTIAGARRRSAVERARVVSFQKFTPIDRAGRGPVRG